MRIGIIGYGRMGQALLPRLERHYGAGQLFVAGRHADQLPSERSSTDAVAIADQVDLVLICVKPQSFAALASQLKGHLQHKRLLSIMTGISLHTLQELTGCPEVVRAMPNLPSAVGKGFTAWVSTSDAPWAVELLEVFGQQLRLQDEAQLDSVTAVSGSGPAYFFYLCEQMAQQALQYGFTSEQARLMAEITLIGAAELLTHGTRSAAEWRQAVTSPNGTTHAAIQHLQAGGFGKLVGEAMDRAKARSEELANPPPRA